MIPADGTARETITMNDDSHGMKDPANPPGSIQEAADAVYAFRGAMFTLTPRVDSDPHPPCGQYRGSSSRWSPTARDFFRFDSNLDKYVSWGANYPPLSTSTEPWRLLTAMFTTLAPFTSFSTWWPFGKLGPSWSA